MLLVVDDDADIRDSLGDYLGQNGHDVALAANAEEARACLRDGQIDLAIVDVMMPGEDGLSLCRHICEHVGVPVILLTALAEDMDRIIGLEIGADDYLTKPFNPRELLARIKAVLRRSAGAKHTDDATSELLCFGDFHFDLLQQKLTRATGEIVELSSAEARLLTLLAEAPGRVFSRETLLAQTSNRALGVFDRSIDNQIARLRKKIETDPKKPELIKTVRGGGYRFAAPVTGQGKNA